MIAAEALGLILHPTSYPAHDAYDAKGDIQTKMTAGNMVSMYSTSDRLVVLRVISPEQAEIVYDGCGGLAWSNSGKMMKNGQRTTSLSRLRALSASN